MFASKLGRESKPGCSKQWIIYPADNFCPLDKCGCSKVVHWTNMLYPGQLLSSLIWLDKVLSSG